MYSSTIVSTPCGFLNIPLSRLSTCVNNGVGYVENKGAVHEAMHEYMKMESIHSYGGGDLVQLSTSAVPADTCTTPCKCSVMTTLPVGLQHPEFPSVTAKNGTHLADATSSISPTHSEASISVEITHTLPETALSSSEDSELDDDFKPRGTPQPTPLSVSKAKNIIVKDFHCYKCTLCEKCNTFKTIDAVKTHLLDKHGSVLLNKAWSEITEKPRKIPSRKRNVKQTKPVSSDGKISVSCSRTRRTSKKANVLTLTDYVVFIDEESGYRCPVCGNIMLHKRSVVQHMKTKHHVTSVGVLNQLLSEHDFKIPGGKHERKGSCRHALRSQTVSCNQEQTGSIGLDTPNPLPKRSKFSIDACCQRKVTSAELEGRKWSSRGECLIDDPVNVTKLTSFCVTTFSSSGLFSDKGKDVTDHRHCIDVCMQYDSQKIYDTNVNKAEITDRIYLCDTCGMEFSTEIVFECHSKQHHEPVITTAIGSHQALTSTLQSSLYLVPPSSLIDQPSSLLTPLFRSPNRFAPPSSCCDPPRSDLPPSSAFSPKPYVPLSRPSTDFAQPSFNYPRPTSHLTRPSSHVAPPTTRLAPPTTCLAPPTTHLAPSSTHLALPIAHKAASPLNEVPWRECSMCDSVFKSFALWISHELLHEKMGTMMCRVCGKLGSSAVDVRMHLRHHDVVT